MKTLLSMHLTHYNILKDITEDVMSEWERILNYLNVDYYYAYTTSVNSNFHFYIYTHSKIKKELIKSIEGEAYCKIIRQEVIKLDDLVYEFESHKLIESIADKSWLKD